MGIAARRYIPFGIVRFYAGGGWGELQLRGDGNPLKIMSDKQKIIAKIIALQKKFIAKQHAGDGQVDLAEDDAELRDYKKQHEKLATELVDLAHRERGTSR